MSTDTVTDIGTVADERGRLLVLKDNISSLFGELGDFMLTTSRKISEFRTIISPYINYFYPLNPETATESFAGDVVIPSRNEMNGAIDEAVAIMQGDSRINNSIAESIQRTLDIRKSVDEILTMIEAIDLYSVNTMLISTKAGAEGETLAQISSEMTVLSDKAGKISTEFISLLQTLETSYDEFSSVREKIDITNENYLTQMKVKSSLVFGEILTDLGRLSANVAEIMKYSEEVESSITSVMEWLQTEDLVRQDLEKVIVALEEAENGGNRLFDRSGDPGMAERITELLYGMSMSKIQGLEHHIERLITGNTDCNERIKDILNRFINRFYGSHGDGKQYYEGEKLDTVYEKLENMKNEYISYIQKIIEGKRELFELSSRILDVLGRFTLFFNELVQIAKRFEIINMLTKIELARHSNLKKTLTGALTGVRDLPTQMKKIIERSLATNAMVAQYMEASIREYQENYLVQERTLNNCIQAMRKISVKLNESKKYYQDISEEVGGTCTRMLGFIEHESGEIEAISDLKNTLKSLFDKVSRISRNTHQGAAGEYDRDADMMRQHLSECEKSGEYRTRMLISMISEYQHQLPEERVYIF